MGKPSVEERAQALFRAAGSSEPLSPEALQSVWQKTEPKLRSGLWNGLAPKLLVVSLLAVGAWWWLRAPVVTVPAVIAPMPTEVKVAPPVVVVEPEPVKPEAVAVAEVKVASPPRVRLALGGPAPLPVVEEDPLLAESRLLARAVSQLRDEHDAAGALSTLDEHARRFSHGVLVREAQLARVESLVAAGQRGAALTLLESMDLSQTPRGEDLRVLEGELLAESGRCDEAVRVLDVALGSALVREAEDRAAYRRATCLPEGAQRSALEGYLRRFPRGKFVEQARSRLEPE